MPRKQRLEKKKITVVVDGKSINATLSPPSGTRKSWYVYWAGMTTSKATGATKADDAVRIAEDMIRNGGKRTEIADLRISDDEFVEIQRVHFSRRHDPDAKKRSAKSLTSCLSAITAFQKILKKPLAFATADDCSKFQRDALMLAKNWRSNRTSQKDKTISVNTVLQWSRSLQAAYQRANRNAGRKCVRGVVDESKLLTENPWQKFQWLEGTDKEIRQFDPSELASLLEFLASKFPTMTVPFAMAKVYFWSAARRAEIASLKWSNHRQFDSEHHFSIVGKWGVQRWFRVPAELMRELESLRTEKDFVFDGYAKQIRQLHHSRGKIGTASHVRESFIPSNASDWLYRQVADWSESAKGGPAGLHVFRKTALQHATEGEEIASRVAGDARVTAGVMTSHYVIDSDKRLREASNRTFARLVTSLPSDIAARYGHNADSEHPSLQTRLDAAIHSQDWKEVARIAGQLSDGAEIPPPTS